MLHFPIKILDRRGFPQFWTAGRLLTKRRWLALPQFSVWQQFPGSQAETTPNRYFSPPKQRHHFNLYLFNTSVTDLWKEELF